MITLFIICGSLIFAAWLFGIDHEPPRESKETLDEVCPNEGTSDFAYWPEDDIKL